jgi:hypothetical protein
LYQIYASRIKYLTFTVTAYKNDSEDWNKVDVTHFLEVYKDVLSNPKIKFEIDVIEPQYKRVFPNCHSRHKVNTQGKHTRRSCSIKE